MTGGASGSALAAWTKPRLAGLRLQTLSVTAGKSCSGSPNFRPADAGNLQKLRRADGAGREDGFARGRLDHAAAGLVFEPPGARAVEQDPPRVRAGDEAQIGPLQRRLEERLGGADAQAAAL